MASSEMKSNFSLLSTSPSSSTHGQRQQGHPRLSGSRPGAPPELSVTKALTSLPACSPEKHSQFWLVQFHSGDSWYLLILLNKNFHNPHKVTRHGCAVPSLHVSGRTHPHPAPGTPAHPPRCSASTHRVCSPCSEPSRFLQSH